MSTEFSGYADLLQLYHTKRKEYPSGVSPKLSPNKKAIYLQFTDPITGSRTSKGCNTEFSELGVFKALEKANKVAEKLKEVDKASEFWEWYNHVILECHSIKNNMIPYSQIFARIEDEYFNGRNRNTKRKRSREIPNDVKSFNGYYLAVFKRFPKWDKYPQVIDFKNVLYSYKEGTKKYKDCYSVLSKIAKYCHNKVEIEVWLDTINPEQTEFRDKQSISLSEFLAWHDAAINKIPYHHKNYNSHRSWLWVASMMVIYGLRPTEIMASKNLYDSVIIDNVEIPAINDSNNKNLLLYIDDFFYLYDELGQEIKMSVKTGKRLIKPVTTDKELIYRLKIQSPLLPTYTPKSTSKPESIVSGFDGQFTARLRNLDFPITQKYALRHLYNQLGEMYGIPQEIRSRSMGHSPTINQIVYKKRFSIQTEIDILTHQDKDKSVTYELAKQRLLRHNEQFTSYISDVDRILSIIFDIDENFLD